MTQKLKLFPTSFLDVMKLTYKTKNPAVDPLDTNIKDIKMFLLNLMESGDEKDGVTTYRKTPLPTLALELLYYLLFNCMEEYKIGITKALAVATAHYPFYKEGMSFRDLAIFELMWARKDLEVKTLSDDEKEERIETFMEIVTGTLEGLPGNDAPETKLTIILELIFEAYATTYDLGYNPDEELYHVSNRVLYSHYIHKSIDVPEDVTVVDSYIEDFNHIYTEDENGQVRILRVEESNTIIITHGIKEGEEG